MLYNYVSMTRPSAGQHGNCQPGMWHCTAEADVQVAQSCTECCLVLSCIPMAVKRMVSPFNKRLLLGCCGWLALAYHMRMAVLSCIASENADLLLRSEIRDYKCNISQPL
jgi:hypothetical protein